MLGQPHPSELALATRQHVLMRVVPMTPAVALEYDSAR